jgi:ABC-2 type transport system ATP-binding protein
VDNVSFDVPRGSVTGFFGPNGSGKTTTMRIMLGLAQASAGMTLFDGWPLARIPNAARSVGAVLDASTLNSGRTVRQTMQLVCLGVGLAQSRGGEMINTVGLAKAERQRVGRLSLGMRQRLALACAVVPDPDYLLLDEPMNGLDPEGIDWLRAMLLALARAGKGVLVSTHLISEIADMADHVVVINRGRVVAAQDKRTLLDSGGRQTIVRSANDRGLEEALSAQGIVVKPEGEALRCDCEPEVVCQVAFDEGIMLRELRPVESSLREFVLGHTRGEFRAQPRLTPPDSVPEPEAGGGRG